MESDCESYSSSSDCDSFEEELTDFQYCSYEDFRNYILGSLNVARKFKRALIVGPRESLTGDRICDPKKERIPIEWIDKIVDEISPEKWVIFIHGRYNPCKSECNRRMCMDCDFECEDCEKEEEEEIVTKSCVCRFFFDFSVMTIQKYKKGNYSDSGVYKNSIKHYKC